MKGWLKSNLITGLLVLLPIILTLYIIYHFITFTDGLVVKVLAYLLPSRYQPEGYLPIAIPGFGLIVTLVVIMAAGIATRSYLGRRIIGLWERILQKIPFVRSLYGGIKQLAESIFKQSTDAFRKVIMIEYPRKGIYVLGFATGEARGEVQERTQKKMINVFVPTTPNPTSGFYILVPEDEAVFLDMSVEDGFKLIISGGMIDQGNGQESFKNNTALVKEK